MDDSKTLLEVARRYCASQHTELLCVPGCTNPDRWAVFFKAFWSALSKFGKAATVDEDIAAVGRFLSKLQLLLSIAVVENGFGNSFKSLFEEVHRSNMSKACLSSEEAEQTQAHYKKVYGVDSLVQVGTGSDEYRYFVFRASDGKVLKCVNYSPANLEPIVAEAAAVWQPNGATTTKQQARDENDDDSSSDDDDSSDDSDEAPRSLELVASFHRFFGAPVVAKPSIPPLARTNLRIALITEEAKELKQASDVQSIVDIADALCDLQYVLSGTVLEFGFGSTFGGVFADYLSDPEFISKVLPLL